MATGTEDKGILPVSGLRTRYRPRRIHTRDGVVMIVSSLAPIALAILSTLDEPSLTWTTSPLQWPTVAVAPLLALLALTVPAVAAPAPDPARPDQPTPHRPTP